MQADVIVVGAGSAGAAVARRLVERAGMSVLLIEAGGEDTSEAIHDPFRAAELWFAPEDWAYETVSQPHAHDRRLHWPRGKVLGGSSSLNGMIWVRGAREDWDHWAYLGNAGWSWEDVLPIFLRIEDFDGEPSELHATGGPQRVHTRYRPDPIQESVMAAIQEVGVPFNPDYNSGRLDGAGWIQLTVKDGRRHSACDAYLRPVLDHPDLTVLTRLTPAGC